MTQLTFSSAPNGTGGRFIFVTSTNYRNARLAQAHVCAAKAGVNALSDCISMEYGPKGITSNVIAPGPIADTEGMSRLVQSENRDAAIRNVPVQRFGLVKEIADATVFLFADTGNFVNGAYIDVDGGAWRIAGGKGSGAGLPYPEILDSSAVGQRRVKPESVSKI
jgi:2,4-dienoyl-CoA reductase [(3E)-enoyl-CoA-producing], peroxisomal